VRLLLDTHVALWSLQDSPRLGKRARAVIVDGRNRVFVSAISVVEVAIKSASGKLHGADEFVELCAEAAFEELSLTAAHADGLRSLPDFHRDPFDRLLISQSLVNGLTLITADARCRQYSVETLDAER